MNLLGVHQFANGVRVFDDHPHALQRSRHQQRNVHEEQEEPVFLRLVGEVQAGGIFVNIGYYALLAKLKRPDLTIWGFEPLPQHVRFFLENVEWNRFRWDEFNVRQQAVAPREGTAEFSNEDYSSQVVSGVAWLYHSRGRISVSATTLEMVCRDVGRPVGLIQMDIQGLEYEVLKRFAKHHLGTHAHIAAFLAGTHGCDQHEDCRSVFSALHYQIVHDEPAPAGQPDGSLAAAIQG